MVKNIKFSYVFSAGLARMFHYQVHVLFQLKFFTEAKQLNRLLKPYQKTMFKCIQEGKEQYSVCSSIMEM